MERIDFKNLDRKSKIEIIITALMVLVFIAAFGNSLRVFMQKKKPAAQIYVSADAFKEIIKRDLTMGQESSGEKTAKLKDAEARQKEESAPWGRDPFDSKDALLGEAAIADLRLEGIIWDKEAPYAIINGETLKKGDRIGSSVITAINQDSVIVSDGAKIYTLHIEQ